MLPEARVSTGLDRKLRVLAKLNKTYRNVMKPWCLLQLELGPGGTRGHAVFSG